MKQKAMRRRGRSAHPRRNPTPTSGTGPQRGSPLSRDLAAAITIAVVVMAVFANSIGNGFVYDDIAAIESNTRIENPGDLGTFFTTGYWSDGRGALYRPLTVLSFAWDQALFGPGPFGVHLVNVLANALLAVVTYAFLRILTGSFGLAILAALVYAIHPVHTEVVANGVGRAEILSALFLVLAAWTHVLVARRSVRDSAPAAKPGWLFFVPPTCFLAALFFKESAVVLPALLFLGEWLVLGRGRLPRGSAVVARFVVFLPPLVLFLILRTMAVGNALPEIQEVMVGLDPAGRTLFGAATLFEYTIQMVVPWTLCAEYSDYRAPLPSTVSHPLVAGALVTGVAAVLLGFWLYRRRHGIPLFGMVWFFIAIFPVSNILFPIGTVRADRLLFVPSLGFAVTAAWIILRIGTRKQWAAVALCVSLLGFYGWRTVTRNAEWKSQETLWSADIHKNPGTPVGWAFLGDIYRDRGDAAQAEDAYRRSFELRDRLGFYPESHNNYGLLLSARGAVAEAEKHYRLVLDRDPNQFTALVNLGELKISASETRNEAIRLLRRAASIKPDDFIPWANLATAYQLAGRADSALVAVDQAIRLRPDLRDLQLVKREIVAMKAGNGAKPAGKEISGP